MGPAMAGSAASRRSTPRSNFAPSIAPSTSSSSSLGAGLSQTAPPGLKKDVDLKGKGKEVAKQDEDEEPYSDPDEGVEIIDMERVREMDWMAPESLRKEKATKKKVKKEQVNDPDIPGGNVDTINALNLSESEEEEEPELEDVIEDFATQSTSGDPSLREDRLYLFQFPSPFPTFLPNIKPSDNEDIEMTDSTKKVSFGPDVKPPVEATPATSRTASTVPSEIPRPEPLNGVIGHLEVYRSGIVKIRLGNDIVLDVNPATQPSFLQQAVYLDRNEKRLSVLGEVNKQFVASPDVDVLLQALEEADNQPSDAIVLEGEEQLVKI
ncbi:hypothetical protein EST38_g11179 [Candolleomyces aberdarensis]|uniref:DNA-directed RNA polymerase III subunit RPC4 n=1 Tax=Candolleomyces aberdarensis TaxID=2316362 RepID=A0A4Q2D7T9_9AGAR|nr:hypothetical protein EST38_g11179 [Candolleomyces aberdarensis]